MDEAPTSLGQLRTLVVTIYYDKTSATIRLYDITERGKKLE